MPAASQEVAVNKRASYSRKQTVVHPALVPCPVGAVATALAGPGVASKKQPVHLFTGRAPGPEADLPLRAQCLVREGGP